MDAAAVLLELLRMLLAAYNEHEESPMEIALLARGFALLVAELVDQGILTETEESKEIRAIAQTYAERARAQEGYHRTRRGELALERADAALEENS